MNVCLIIPARNEEAVIGKMITMTLAVYNDFIKSVIVVDDGSTDRTKKIVTGIAKADKRVKLINNKGPHGVGLALRKGLKHVPVYCDFILTMDADFIRNLPDLSDLFAAASGYDGVIGSRYLVRHSLIHYPLLKRFFNRAFHLLVRLFLGIKRSDLTNNFKLYKRGVYLALNLTASDYSVNAETGLYPLIMGYKINEIPVIWFARSRNMGQSKFKLIKVLPGYLKVLLLSSNKSNYRNAKFLRPFAQLIK